MKRLKRVYATSEIVEDFLHGRVGSHREITSNLPPDARVVGCHWDQPMWCAVFTLASDAFDEVKEGDEPPYFHVVHQVEPGVSS